MKHFVKLHRFPSKTVIVDYSNIKTLDEQAFKGHIVRLRKYIEGTSISENQWTKIWKRKNLVHISFSFFFKFCNFGQLQLQSSFPDKTFFKPWWRPGLLIFKSQPTFKSPVFFPTQCLFVSRSLGFQMYKQSVWWTYIVVFQMICMTTKCPMETVEVDGSNDTNMYEKL